MNGGTIIVLIWEKIKENRWMVLVFLILLIFGFSYLAFFKEKETVLLPAYTNHTPESDQTVTVASEPEPQIEPMIMVDVKGAVMHPGVYELIEKSRVIDAIDRAGGSEPEADLSKVNLAAFLKDGQVVYIPRNGEEKSAWENEGIGTSDSGSSNAQININTATLEELTKLPGIGPSKAQAIISYREEHGSFKDIKDLTKVSGIGQKTFEKLLPLVTIR